MSEDEHDISEHVDSIDPSIASESRKCRKKGKSKVTNSVLIDLVESTEEIRASL
ncbi:hypothetical protein KSP40_PGU002728 [Platanthera guangdongensis]|uniref:Uncharacterized protein n=1 Tax=Platanthera guangdongensis TaxID=2320717 RepID=A0ABR2LLT1_9ASPA